jgi:hypothetical protein
MLMKGVVRTVKFTMMRRVPKVVLEGLASAIGTLTRVLPHTSSFARVMVDTTITAIVRPVCITVRRLLEIAHFRWIVDGLSGGALRKVGRVVNRLSGDTLTQRRVARVVDRLSGDALTQRRVGRVVDRLFGDALTRRRVGRVVDRLFGDALTRRKVGRVVDRLPRKALRKVGGSMGLKSVRWKIN